MARYTVKTTQCLRVGDEVYANKWSENKLVTSIELLGIVIKVCKSYGGQGNEFGSCQAIKFYNEKKDQMITITSFENSLFIVKDVSTDNYR